MKNASVIFNKKIEKYLFCLFTIVLSIILFTGLKNITNIVIYDDEFGYWGIAAHLSGRDWTNMASLSSYVSYGYSLWLVPLFKLININIYQSAALLNIFFILIAYFISYSFISKIYPKTDKKILIAICFTGSIYPTSIVYTRFSLPESLLTMLIWIIIYLFFKMVETNKNIYTILLALVNTYIYMVHQRCIGIVFVTSILILFLGFTNNISRKKICVFFSVLLIGFCVHVIIKRYLVTNFWFLSTTLEANDYQGQIGKVKNFTSFSGIILILKSFLGKIFYLGIATGFTVIVAFLIKIKDFRNILMKKSLRNLLKLSTREMCGLALGGYTFIQILIASIYMLPGIGARLDTLIYGRYIEFLFPILLVFGLHTLYERKNWIKKGLSATLIMLFLSVFVRKTLIEFENMNYNSITSICITHFLQLDKNDISNINTRIDDMTIIPVLSITLLIVVFLLINSSSYYRKYFIIPIICMHFYYLNVTYTLLPTLYDHWWQKNTTMQEVALYIKDNNFNNIYYFSQGEDSKKIETVQFLLPDYKISLVNFEELNEIMVSENDILISNQAITQISDNIYSNSNFYIYNFNNYN